MCVCMYCSQHSLFVQRAIQGFQVAVVCVCERERERESQHFCVSMCVHVCIACSTRSSYRGQSKAFELLVCVDVCMYAYLNSCSCMSMYSCIVVCFLV
jgi:hypothetical protein